MAARYGLIGRTLGHSYSPLIHKLLSGLDYDLVELEPEDVAPFLAGDTWDGLNVTIPYKKTVTALVDEVTPVAERLGSVNTVVRQTDGTLLGDNTDYAGFSLLLDTLGIDLMGSSAVVLGGHGGAGTTCMAVLADRGVEAQAISRSGPVTYDDLDQYCDVDLVVNATPVGMAPACPAAPVDLARFNNLAAVVDIVYNPMRTGLLLQAERLGIPAVSGLAMLVGQAAAAQTRFCGTSFSLDDIASVCQRIAQREQNIVLIGMPGAGKTRVGQQIARLLGRAHVDADWELEKRLDTTCSEFITTHGEEAFRVEETATLRSLGARSGLVISCGGGCVTRPENYDLMHQNGIIVLLDRKLEELSSKGRPLSERDGVEALAQARMPLYRAWADMIMPSQSTAEATAQGIVEHLELNDTATASTC